MSFFLNKRIDITNLTCWYQPIYEVHSMEAFGFEALVRSKLYHTFNAIELFHQAQIQRTITILDYQLILKAQQLFRYKNTHSLFINIFPSTLLDKKFIPWWKEFSSLAPQIVLELSEEEPITDWENLKSVIKVLKKDKVKIAVDDMGEGYSFLKHLLQLEPDYIKLDRCHMTNLIDNKAKQKNLEDLVNLIGPSIEIIAEGIEDINCVEIIKNIGIRYAQGYALGKPAPIDKFY